MTVDNKRGAQQSTNSTVVDADKRAQMNAVWQRIESKAGERGKLEKQNRTKRAVAEGGGRRRLSRLQIVIICVVAVVVVAAVMFFVWFFVLRKPNSVDKEPTITDQANEIVNVNVDSSEELSNMIGESQSKYDEYFAELLNTDAAKWTSEDIEKVHFCVAYASKVGLTQDLITLLGNINYAVDSGVNVYSDDFTEEYVNQIKQQVNNPDASQGIVYEEAM